MHDGQNLFDAATSYSGEWGVDETLDRLHASGDWGCIVVGIDNGGADRLNEYAPWVNAQYGGGQGDEYLDFLADNLKPYMDANYRTLPARQHTGIMGSSMGGLISLYATLKKPQVFGRAGVFSPAFWFNPEVYSFASTQPRADSAKVQILMGGRESSTYYYPLDMRRMAGILGTAGYAVGPLAEIDTLVRADGQHAEWFWKREFSRAYQYLFAATAPSASKTNSKSPIGFLLYPSPSSDSNLLMIETTNCPKAKVLVSDSKGRTVLAGTVALGKASLPIGTLPKGVYVVTVSNQGKIARKTWLRQ